MEGGKRRKDCKIETKDELPLIPDYEVKAADVIDKLYEIIKTY